MIFLHQNKTLKYVQEIYFIKIMMNRLRQINKEIFL